MGELVWTCLHCPATGTTDTSAAKHTKDTQHATVTSLTGVAAGKGGES